MRFSRKQAIDLPVRPPLQTECFAGARSAEQVDAHQAEIVRILNGSHEARDLLRSHRLLFHCLRFRHLHVLCGIVINELPASVPSSVPDYEVESGI